MHVSAIKSLLIVKRAALQRLLDLYLSGEFHKDMLINKFGRIINIVSLSGLKGLPGQANYSAAKAGVIGATKALAQEVAAKGVTVNTISPGYIATPMVTAIPAEVLSKIVAAIRWVVAVFG